MKICVEWQKYWISIKKSLIIFIALSVMDKGLTTLNDIPQMQINSSNHSSTPLKNMDWTHQSGNSDCIRGRTRLPLRYRPGDRLESYFNTRYAKPIYNYRCVKRYKHQCSNRLDLRCRYRYLALLHNHTGCAAGRPYGYSWRRSLLDRNDCRGYTYNKLREKMLKWLGNQI